MPRVVRAQLDYYAVLEIAPSADGAEVNAAFRRLAWRCHPDRNPAPGATLQFQDINEAHQVLSDPARRADYDARWHPRPEHRQTVPPIQYRVRRRWRPHRHARTVLLGIGALLFVSSAWAVIFTAMTAAHSSGPSYFVTPATIPIAGGSSNCSLSMEILPVVYSDGRGHIGTAWETEVHDCYGGATRLSSLQQLRPTRGSRFAYDPEVR